MNGIKIVGGLLFVLVVWAVAAFFILVTMMGDCFPGEGHVCPTDHQRHVVIAVAFFGALSISAIVLFLISRMRVGPDDKNSN